MLQVGLTGNIGSGKTTVCKVFEKLGVPVFYADLRARMIMDREEVTARVAGTFGKEILDAEGKLNRRTLAGIVFNDKEKLALLNGIIHPLVREDFLGWVGENKEEPYIIKEAAILFEAGMASQFDKIIVVAAPLEVRIARVMHRDGVSREEVLGRAANQFDEEELVARADYVIHNDDRQLVVPTILCIDQSLRSLQQF
ncbi:MAG: dephospho-CoA kinase [Bacteroidales bacterium]|jgi:dephospho-CoA kinase|nr:dephospho-CoA kinase [Bacteroidales bacterium]NLM93596.1 dephospho-CoA kinase [Bacteroidales bacterium]